VGILSMLSGPAGQAGDGVPVDADEAAGLPGTVALGQVIEHGTSLVLGQVRAEQWSAFAFGEAVFANPAVKQANVILLAEAAADSKVACTTLPVKRAVGVQATETREIVHGAVEGAGRCQRVRVQK
jgi:hypothetical protein